MNQSHRHDIPNKHIVMADRFDESLLISFEDGTTAMYAADFLYDHRNDDGNHTLIDESDDDNAA